MIRFLSNQYDRKYIGSNKVTINRTVNLVTNMIKNKKSKSITPYLKVDSLIIFQF